MADVATGESDRIDELSKLVQALSEENATLKRQLLILNEKLFARERELFGASSENALCQYSCHKFFEKKLASYRL